MRAMDARGSVLMAASLLLAMGALASPGIYRCTGPGGHVTYQEIPCPNDSAQRATDIPTEYPEVNREARERLSARGCVSPRASRTLILLRMVNRQICMGETRCPQRRRLA